MGELRMIAGYVTTAEAAAELGVGPSRVLKLIDANRLRAQKVGRDWMIRKADLDAVRERPNGRPPGRTRKDAGHGAGAARAARRKAS